MGMTPPVNSTMSSTPAEEARQLMQRKEALEAELDAQMSVLRANKVTMQTPLVDAQGFPRDDIDLWNVRLARVRIIELRNDLSALTIELGKVLEKIYDPKNATESEVNTNTSSAASADGSRVQEDIPFAKVNAVAPGSPAAEAGLLRGDLILKFGDLIRSSFETPSSLQPLAELVNINENRTISIKVLRTEETVTLRLIPRNGWGGRGMLGCHIIPYTP